MKLTQVPRRLLDILLPQNSLARRVERVTAEELRAKISHSNHQAEMLVLFDYRDALIRELFLSLKFHGNRSAAKLFAEVLYDPLLAELGDRHALSAFDRPLLIPIPLSKERLRERGYNQSELVAQKLAEMDKNRSFELASNALVKIKNVPPQTSLPDKEAREQNIIGAFAVASAPVVSNRNIILLDDITTTGSTLGEATKTLKAAGAKQVFCIALAH